MTRPGLIDALAAETDSRQRREAEVAEREATEREAKDEKRRRLRASAARRQAMVAAKQMTGLVIFPARWALTDSERSTVICTERIEGRVEVTVEVSVAVYSSANIDTETRAVVVRRVGGDDLVSWKQPSGRLSPVGGRSIESPGREWFRRALIELGVIG